MKNQFPKYEPTGDLQGDTRSMPDRGCNTGVDDSYGADLSGDATNRIGSLNAKSDSAFEDMVPDPTFGENAQDVAEDANEA